MKRRVPSRFAGVEPRDVIWESLKTDSRAIALSKAQRVWSGYLDGWEALLAGRDGDAEARFRAARDLAARRGYAFLTADAVADLDLIDVLRRVEATQSASGDAVPDVAEAVLGGTEDPGLMLSGLVAHTEDIASHDNRFKSTQQMRLWRNPRIRAVRNLIAAIGGDRRIVDVGAAEAIQHRKWWQDKLKGGKLKAASA
ncbi:integrase, partial [Loktanella sp. SALINAS62]|nr:integrase [Loktanella sp. SALINAS62]